jgi:hypothetical protein
MPCRVPARSTVQTLRMVSCVLFAVSGYELGFEFGFLLYNVSINTNPALGGRE